MKKRGQFKKHPEYKQRWVKKEMHRWANLFEQPYPDKDDVQREIIGLLDSLKDSAIARIGEENCRASGPEQDAPSKRWLLAWVVRPYPVRVNVAVLDTWT